MGKLLVKLFIKDYKDTENPKVRNAYGKLSGVVGVISNLILSIIKIATGVISMSMAILADGLNNLTDASASIITFIGFKYSSKPADKDHPFGHQRVEYITGLIISFFILFVGFSLFRSGIEKIINPEDIDVSIPIIILLFISILIKIWQFFFYRRNGKLIKSKTLMATSIDSLNDVITTTVVLISIIITFIFGYNLDGYMTVIVAIFIMISGVQLIKETISPLIGEAPPKDLIKNVAADILAYEGVLGLHDLVIHLYGPGKSFITAHVEVDGDSNVTESHAIIDRLEKDINDKYKTTLVIHMDPVETNDEYTIKVKEDITKLLEEIDPVLKFHDFRVIKGKLHDHIIFDIVVPSSYPLQNDKLNEIINQKVEELNPRFHLIIHYDISFEEEE